MICLKATTNKHSRDFYHVKCPLTQKQHEIIPIEVKSSSKGSMNSLFQFLKEKNRQEGIRISLENFSIVHDIKVIPLYAVSNVIQTIVELN